MIAASEPLEFVPRGRQAVEEHPGPMQSNQQTHLPSENVLLQRMQNVNISAAEEQHNEYWCVREVYEGCTDVDDIRKAANMTHKVSQQRDTMAQPQKEKAASQKEKTQTQKEKVYPSRVKHNDYATNATPPSVAEHEECMWEFAVNSEEELYVKKHTAVWTRGLTDKCLALPRICFTCDTPIKFAFFCNASFVHVKKASSKQRPRTTANLPVDSDDGAPLSGICLIDQTSLRTYCSNGEDFMSNLEFPVSNVWPTLYCVLLEKVASNAMVQRQTIAMPRLFSLTHPLDELCPVLSKSSTKVVNYLSESDYSIVFSAHDSDLLLLYDRKIGKHFVSRLRKASEEEVHQVAGVLNDTMLSGSDINFCLTRLLNAPKPPSAGTARHSSAHLARTSLGATHNYTTHISKFLTGSHSFGGGSTSGHGITGNRNFASSPLSHLQSTIGQHSFSGQDLRKVGQAQPSKPIVPEMCIEHIWTENTYGKGRDFKEVATRAFIHTDLVAQQFLCYLLARSTKLQLVQLRNYGTAEVQLSAQAFIIAAKDARMKMLAVLDPCGVLMLYTGQVLMSKVHVSSPMVPPSLVLSVSTTGAQTRSIDAQSPNVSFPRRSSLLPTAQKNGDDKFDEELHLLSPVHPLQPQSQFTKRNGPNVANVCIGLRDPAGNRLTLVYSSGKMYRLKLPLLNETRFVTRCLAALRHMLPRDLYVQTVRHWYAARNPPGATAYSVAHEWEVFRNVLSELLGCSGAKRDPTPFTSPSSFPAEQAKKRRKDAAAGTVGNAKDWTYLQAVLSGCIGDHIRAEASSACHAIDTTSLLFRQLPVVFYGMHLLYEDFKLETSLHSYLAHMAKFLHQLATDMQLATYTFHYACDFPQLIQRTTKSCVLTEQHATQMDRKELLQVGAPSIFKQLENVLKGRDELPYTYVDGVNDMSRNVLQIVSLIMHGHELIRKWIKPLEFPDSVYAFFPPRPKRFISINVPRSEQVIQTLINMDMTRDHIGRLPVALHLIIAECLENSRLKPPIGRSPATYELILRTELAEHAKLQYGLTTPQATVLPHRAHRNYEDSLSARCVVAAAACIDTSNVAGSSPELTTTSSAVNEDGMENIDTRLLSLRYPDDMRVTEVRRLLSSADPVTIDVTQSPGTSDHEFIEEQEKQLYALCTRTMTLPLGRGMFTLRTAVPTPTESAPIPRLCLSGRDAVKGATIEMQQIEFPANMNVWPTFHNGVAAGLKISPHTRDVDSTWIVYNKPKTQAENATEHAGFLMALGLNGHLQTLSYMSVFDYLVKCDEMTSLGLLLGIAAAHRGTMDNTATKLLSVHIEALLPATALELDVPQNIQVASLMSIGLVYQGTAKRHIAEVLLQEVGRPPGPEMENSVERESYALTAGLALGLVTLGQGESPAGLRDLQLPDTLHYYMMGGRKRTLTGAQKEKYKLPSFQVREGDIVNIDVTAPGATLALGLMFFDTDNRAVAEWMNAPNTRYLLDLVRPDLLLLRTIARNLIMWSEVRPNEQWLFEQFPTNLRFDLDRGAQTTSGSSDDDVDHEAVTQAYCNIIAGAAFCMGLKYAGTENPEAFKALRKAIKLFLGFPGKYVGEFAGRMTIETGLMIILLAIALVFAGSGDLEILRIIRYLRSRTGAQHSQVTYGSQMAIHMSLGLLFLGAGRYTIAKTPEAVAALVCALFPKFPNHSNDNRYHLQAFRHLYVLAVEPRLFLPRDIDTKKLCLCQISVLEVGSKQLRRLQMAPCILPELKTLQKVIVDDPNYWPVCFEKKRNWQQLVNALENSACIDIKKRSGCLSHLEDPDRLKSLFAQTLTAEQYLCWEIDPKALERFSNEWRVRSFADRILSPPLSKSDLSHRQRLMMLFYNAVIKDKLHVMPIYLSLFESIQSIEKHPENMDIWQLKLIDAYMEQRRCDVPLLFSRELVQASVERFKLCVENASDELSLHLRLFLTKVRFDASTVIGLNALQVALLIAVINYYNLMPNLLNLVDLSGTVNYLRYLYEFKKLNMEENTIFCLIKVLQQTDLQL